MQIKTTTKLFATAALLAGSTLFTISSQASFVLLDNMNYGTTDEGGGVGDWLDGSNRLKYEASVNLTFTGDADYVNDGSNLADNGSLERNDNSDSRYFRRDFSDGTVAGEVWLSGLLSFSGGLANEFAGISLTETASINALNADLLGVGLPADGIYQAVWRDFSGNTSTFDIDNNLSAGTHLLVAKLTIGLGADSFSLWVFDSADSFGQTEASLGTAHLSSNAADFGDQLDKIHVGGNNGPLTHFDQLRISDLSGNNGLQEVLTATIVPEPSSLALLGLGGLMMARRRH